MFKLCSSCDSELCCTIAMILATFSVIKFCSLYYCCMIIANLVIFQDNIVIFLIFSILNVLRLHEVKHVVEVKENIIKLFGNKTMKTEIEKISVPLICWFAICPPCTMCKNVFCYFMFLNLDKIYDIHKKAVSYSDTLKLKYFQWQTM